MITKRQLWDFLHIYFYRDIIGPSAKGKYGYFGKNSRLFKPFISDKHKKNVYIGDNTIICSDSRIQCYPDATGKIGKINVGNNCLIGRHVTFLCGSDITILDGALIASDVLVASENHSIDPETEVLYMSQPLKCKPVTLGEGCWIGEKVCILPGVTIGKKAVVGAGSVVTKSIPDYCMAVGNPAKIIKFYNFESHTWEKT